MEKSIKKYWPIFVLPTFAAFIIGFIVPFIEGIYLSFCKFTTIRDASFVGLSNYVEAFKDNTFTHAFGFTAVFAVVTLVLINVLAFAIALALTQKLSAKLGFWGLVILICWQQIGYMMIVYIAGLQAIPGSLNEAAMIDGANKWQRLIHVTIPNMMPSITICTFLTITNSFKLFDQNLSLTGGEPMHQTEMMALNIYDTFYGRVGYEGVGQAKAVIFFIIVVAIGMIQLYATKSKEVQQ